MHILKLSFFFLFKPKVSYFFSPEKFTSHSLTQILRTLFFFPVFPRKSLQGHSLAQNFGCPQKKVKNGQKRQNKQFFTFWRCFFFPILFFFVVVFFFLEKFTLHSLTHFQRAKKKTALEKKTPFSLTHSILAEKWSKMNFSSEIKKYDTFAITKHIIIPSPIISLSSSSSS